MIIRWDKVRRRLALSSQLLWFIRLRWGAGLAVVLGALIDRAWLGWYLRHAEMIGVGVAILVYNVPLWFLSRRTGAPSRRRLPLVIQAWAQILLDLGCLTLLTAWTGGVHSPLLGFYVFHMVFASLLLPRLMAYGGAAVAGAMLTTGLWLGGHWPLRREDAAVFLGWLVMLLMTVHLANHITRSLRRHRRQLARHQSRIRAMSDQLRRQRRAMTRQDKMAAMGQMAAGVAHEIANPLACIDSMLQLVQRKPDRLDAQTVPRLREQVARINQIVQSLTRFAHPAEADWELAPVNDVVDRVRQITQYHHRMRQVKIDWRGSPGAGWVRVRPHAVEQVLVNLLTNAVDATSDVPDPHVEVRTGQQEGECFIEVSDNGHGILPEHMDHLFEPFFTTKPVGKGTGLGLSISYSLIRGHGGHIEVQSHPDKGSKFTVYLPSAPPVS